jgi:hypothetical protein
MALLIQSNVETGKKIDKLVNVVEGIAVKKNEEPEKKAELLVRQEIAWFNR